MADLFLVSVIKVMLSMLSQDGRTLFDQELYTGFAINSPKPFFLTFAGDVSFFFYSVCSDHVQPFGSKVLF